MSDPHIAIRRELLSGGYEPLPLQGKLLKWKGWNNGAMTSDRLDKIEAAFPDHTNTGLRTGLLVGADIDLIDRAHAMEIEKIFYARLGDTLFRRVGSKGCLLCYRNETPASKITIGTRERRLVEILGAGQQFAAYGVHPNTGQEYEWSNEFLGAEPLQTPLCDLPAVTPEQLYEAARGVEAKLTTLGYGDVRISGMAESGSERAAASIASGRPVTRAIVEAMVRCISPSCDRSDWLIVCAGLVSAPVTDPDWDGLDLFIRWSRGDLHGGTVPANYKGPEDCEAQWRRDMEKLHGN